jgi:hypothetical protein
MPRCDVGDVGDVGITKPLAKLSNESYSCALASATAHRLNIIMRSPRSTSQSTSSGGVSPQTTTENLQTENYARNEFAVRHTMDTLFFTPEQRTGLSGDLMSSELMSSAIKPIKRPIVEAGAAANADQLDEMMTKTAVEAKAIETTGAWDAYDVWRRFIKDARDRRKQHPDNN